MSRTTFHGKSGRFTSPRSAHTVTKGGERFKMVRQLRRIGGKAPAPEPEADVADTVEAAKAKEEMAMFVAASPGWIPLHDVMGAAFGEDLDEWALAHGKTAYNVPPPFIAARVLKITASKVKKALAQKRYIASGRGRAWTMRYTDDLSPGIRIAHYRHDSKDRSKDYWSASAYQGADSSKRWKSFEDKDLKRVLAFANEHAQEAADAMAQEGAI
jgi:hypothetical protein